MNSENDVICHGAGREKRGLDKLNVNISDWINMKFYYSILDLSGGGKKSESEEKQRFFVEWNAITTTEAISECTEQ